MLKSSAREGSLREGETGALKWDGVDGFESCAKGSG